MNMKPLDEEFPPLAAVKTDQANHFAALAAIDVTAQIEKKNNLSYLSWAWAVDRLLRADPSASWTYGEPALFGQTVMVYCTVTAFGKPMTMQLPVMDYKNKAVHNPDAFAVNTAMQRCLVKAIALHGLGLYIYAGEDLPYEEGKGAPTVKESFKTEARSEWDKLDTKTQEWMTSEAMAITVMLADGDIEGAYTHLEGLKLEIDDKTAFWSRLNSTQRSAIKAYNGIVRAATLEALEAAWAAVPKHSQVNIRATYDQRRHALEQESKVAA